VTSIDTVLTDKALYALLRNTSLDAHVQKNFFQTHHQLHALLTCL
jgi:hypothetical protein